MGFYCLKNCATQLRMIHPPPPPPLAAPCVHGDPYGQSAQEGEVIMFSAQTAWFVRMYKYSKTFHRMNRNNHPRDVHTPAITQKVGLLDKRDFQPEQRVRLPHFFASRDSTEAAEGSVQQAWREQRAILRPSDRNRDRIGDAEGSHYSTEQLEQGARLSHFHAHRYSVDTTEGSNQEGRPPIQYTEIPTAAQTSHLV